jgi:hypothetical protein
MPIETRCNGCGKLLRVADEHAGKQARCPGCGNVYAVPNLQAAAPNPAPIITPAPGTSFRIETSNLPPQWYMKTPEGQIYGPATREQLCSWAGEGRVSGDCFLREGERGPWQTADVIFPTLRAPRTRATAASTGGGYAARPRGQTTATNPYTAPQAYAAPQAFSATGYREAHRGGLILTFALLGWFVCPIFAVVAWSMGSEDLGKIRRGQMDPAGQGLTQAGQILGMIQSILFLIGLGFMFLMCMIGALSDM